MERDHPQSNDERPNGGFDRIGRRSYLKAAGTMAAAAGGLLPSVGSAVAADGEGTVELEYGSHDSVTDVYSVGRPEHAQLVDREDATSGSALELSVPANASWGTNTTYDLPANGHGQPTELYQSIRMRLDPDFSFQQAGDNCRVFNAGLNTEAGTAGSGTDGPPTGTDGWSSRLYVRSTGSRTGPFGLNVYTYHMDQQGGPGEEEVIEQNLFRPGEWHDIETYVRVNTVDGGQAVPDGTVRVWVDGTQVYDRNDFRWTTTPEQAHQRAGPVAHWGGPEVPARESRMYFADHRLAVGSNPRS